MVNTLTQREIILIRKFRSAEEEEKQRIEGCIDIIVGSAEERPLDPDCGKVVRLDPHNL